MFRFFRFFILITLLSSLTHSCVKEEYEKIIPNEDGSIAFICGSNDPVTKTTLNGLTTHWVENTDKVGLFSPQANTTAGGAAGVVNISLTAQSSGERAQFSGTVFWGTGEHTFYSYYPYKVGTPAYTAVPVSLPKDQTQSEGDNLNHLGDLDFLVSKPYTAKYPGTSGNGANVSLRYNHLFAILEFQIIRSSGTGAISKVKLTGRVPLGFESGTIDLSQNSPASGVSYGIDGMTNTSNNVIVSLGTAIIPTNDYSTTPKVYMVVLPGTHVGDLKIGVESSGVFKEVVKADVTFERGKKYIVKVDADLASIPIIDGFDLEPVTIDGITWAPVNAGYDADHRYGLLYQWHRKYGIEYLGSETQSVEMITGPISLSDGNLIENQWKFIKKSTSPYDWSTPQQLTWNMSNEFNPCPMGWRVPTSQEYQTLISYGWTWVNSTLLGVDNMIGKWIGPNHDNPDLRPTTALFFPPNGRIQYSSSTGGATNRGSQGFYQVSDLSGTTSTSYVKTLYFTSTSTNIGSLDRSAAGSVRCVKADSNPHPVIKTSYANNVQFDRFTTGGSIESQGINAVTERGVVYSSTVNPTTSNNKIVYAGIDNSYSITITGLNETTEWYYRAYVVSGGSVIYGEQYNILTPPNWGGFEAVTINGVTWAPVNAGYDATHLYGLLYQWSRKYGQGYNTTETPSFALLTSAATISTANSITNKDKFYKISSTQNDCITPQTASWSQTLYNPCPIGWMVPSAEDFNTLIESGSTWVASGINGFPGRWFGGNHSTDRVGSVFLPASGFREVTSGIVSVRNSTGAYWTTTTQYSSIYVSSYVNFTSSFVNIADQFRGMGYSVRCIKQ